MLYNLLTGRGVFASKAFQSGNFILQYRGRLTEEFVDNCYSYEFKFKGKTFL